MKNHRALFFISLSIFISLFLNYRAYSAGIMATCFLNLDESICPKNHLYFPLYPKIGSESELKYRVDKNGLGDISQSETISAVEEVLSLWSLNSSMKFIKDGDGKTRNDITINNFEEFLEPSSRLGYSPIIFDKDGSILEIVFGKGSKEDILGFAGATFLSLEGNKITGILESQALFNGYLFSQANRAGLSLTEIINDFKTTILHEFAHMVGIDHTQGGYINELFSESNFDLRQIPVMFPFLANPNVELHRDDIAAISYAYPKANTKNNFGTIKGNLTKNGKSIKSANLIAYSIDNPAFEVISSASDVKGQDDGEFIIPNLLPGSYIIKVEPIYEDFDGASSVGIYPPPDDPNSIETGFYVNDGKSIKLENYSSLNQALISASKINLIAGETLKLDLNINKAIKKSFSIGGKAINKVNILNYGKEVESKIRLKRKLKGRLRLKLSTEYPNLISFPNGDEIIIKRSRNFKKVLVRFADIESFSKVFENMGLDQIPITLKVEDMDSGYVDESESLIVF